MSNRRAHVWRLAPPSPPCFADRLSWLEFLASAAEGQGTGEQPVLLFEVGKPVRFNLRFNHCCDCTPEYKAAMTAAKPMRCRPEWLTALIVETPHATRTP